MSQIGIDPLPEPEPKAPREYEVIADELIDAKMALAAATEAIDAAQKDLLTKQQAVDDLVREILAATAEERKDAALVINTKTGKHLGKRLYLQSAEMDNKAGIVDRAVEVVEIKA